MLTTSSSPAARLAGIGDKVPAAARSPLFLGYALGPIFLVLIWILRDLHFVADTPMWIYGLILLAPVLPSTLSNIAYSRRPSTTTVHLRAATDSLATTVVAYATGWGPELGLVYTVAAQQLVATSGIVGWRASRVWATVGVVGGQIGIALGYVPSFIRPPEDNGAAVLGLCALYLVSRMATSITSDRERAWKEVQDSEERFRSLVQSSSDLILVLDERSRPIYVSGPCERLLGRTAEELQKTDLASLMHPEEIEPIRDLLRVALNSPEPTGQIPMRVRHGDGQWRHLEFVGTNQRDNPAIGGIVLNLRDITDRRKMEAELAHHATHDALTGLPNRPLFLERLAVSLQRHQGSWRQPAVLFLDVDRFKLINDTLGHEVGDLVLVEASRRLRSAAGPVHTVARFGGDEFVVLCDPVDDPQKLAERLLTTFDQPFLLGGQTYYLTASIGMAAPHGTESLPADLIRDADTAMYRAKERGRGRLEIFDDEARSAALVRVRTEHLLRGAAERGELRLFYQPLVDLTTGGVVGAEALIRWQHPDDGLVTPAHFIDIAEDTGLIVPIGEWVLNTACQQALIWAERGAPIDLSVNVSARQLADDAFIDVVRAALEPLSRCPGRRPRITLEITERVLIREPESVGPRLEELKSLGIELSMDDFGTGYSSLSNLRRYPFDSLKIDRRFVSGIIEREDDGTIVRAIIAMARGLGKTVVAEGVETPEQLATLRRLGCDMAQGYHVGTPQPATESPCELLLPEHRTLLSPAG